tara:strand:+ start:835 stop:2763 length:1929 start_codon:yes stop_codon:yes gene_type:complete
MATVTNRKKLRVTELDFDQIKDNLKTFLKDQDEFKDYDFDGSGLNVLLDTLAYNTHYLGYNANMIANEMFLDTAGLRSSVVSHAKTLGYEVQSARAAKASISVSIVSDQTSITMPAGTKFSTTYDGTDYNFVTANDIQKFKFGNSVNFDSIDVFEGTYVTTRYNVDTSDLEQRYLLRDNRADTSTLTVSVQNSTTDTTSTTFTKATDITQLTSSSNVYYLQETEGGLFEVYFGDGVISKAIADGNIVFLNYVVTNKSEANGASLFNPPSSIASETNITVTTVANAVGGSEPETLRSIKLNAPLNYASQGRAVTTSDYESLVKRVFANTQAVSVFGGEDGSYNSSSGVSSTPEYGKVFISIKSTTGANLTTSQKTQLVNDLKPYTIASISPVIVDPDTTFLRLAISYSYDTSATTLSSSDIDGLITSALQSYNSSTLQTFNSQYRASAVSKIIDESDNSILNNTTNVKLSKFFTPSQGTTTSYNIPFNNALLHPEDGYLASIGGIVSSTGFKVGTDTTSEFFFDDDGQGNIRRYSIVGTTRSYADSTAGSINYTSGLITINNINITGVSDVDSLTSTQIRIVVTPQTNDIVPVRNQILEIDFTNSSLNGNTDAAATSGTSYTTTGSGATATTTVSTSSTSSSY